jgi:geranylgeranyl reductase family protein
VDYDVIVIGGGPSGAAAACTLAKAGVSVCVVDKAVFPRQKLCGGLLSLRSKYLFEAIFEQDWNEAIVCNSSAASFYHRTDLLNRVQDYRNFALTDRLLFDDLLLRLAGKAGAKIVTGNAVSSISLSPPSVQLADGKTLSCKHLIGCDGVYGISAKTLYGAKVNPRKTVFCVELELPLADTTYRTSEPEIYFGHLDWGYSWVFPKGDKLTVGMGGLLCKTKGMTAAFNGFCLDRFGFVPKQKVRGYHLTFRNHKHLLGLDNILLCGDAAGLVDPITGEGIAYAMQSGQLAAQAIIQSLKTQETKRAGKLYKEACRPIVKEIKLAGRLSWLLFPAPAQRLFVKLLPRSSSVAKRYIDLLSGVMTYREFQGFVLGKAVRWVFGRTK